MQIRLLTWLEDLRTNYWFVPTVMAGLAVLLSFATIAIDERMEVEFARSIGFIWTGGPQGARGLLTAVASSMITVAGVTFSITIVALSLASQQFGPRLLRNFMRDRGNQIVLGTFIATFVYSLLVLRTVRETPDAEFVPFLSTTIALLLALASLGVLIFFIHHTALSIQAPIVISEVARDLMAQIDSIFPDELGRGEEREASQENKLPETSRQSICAHSEGYLEAVDTDKIMQVARESDLCLWLNVRPGDFLVKGTVMTEAYPAERVTDEAADRLCRAFVTGRQRTQTQNIEYLIDQLVEVAVRALSSGVNDPFTALNCIDWLGAVLSRLAERRFPDVHRYDDDHVLRVVVVHPETFAGITNAALDQIRQYADSSVAVQIRLLEMLTEVLEHTQGEEDRHPLRQQAEMIWDQGCSSGMRPGDQQDLRKRYEIFTQLARAHQTEITP